MFTLDDVPPALRPQTQSSKGDPVKNSVKLPSVLVSFALMIAGVSQAAAQSKPTMLEKMACRSDAETFCAEQIGKPQEMNACMHDNIAKLSVACRKVVEAHGG